MGNKGKLFLIPTAIAAGTNDSVLTPQARSCLPAIRHFLAEDVRTARRYLSSLKLYDTVESLSFSVLDKDTSEEALNDLFEPAFQGHDMGVLSESGCPGIADPGSLAARFAHRHGIRVVPLVGPSSIVLALMSSGLNGQHFAFHGYLPIDANDAARAIRDYEKESRTKGQTQIFIETPYRNKNLFAHLMKNLKGATDLCIAMDISGEHEFILTQSASAWKKNPPELTKNPAVFLFLAR